MQYTGNTFFFVFVCLLACFVDGYVITNLRNCLLEVSVDDILLQVYNNAHIYTHTHIDTHTNPPTHLHKVLPTIYFSCHLVISNYYKSYQYKYIYVYVYIYIYIYEKLYPEISSKEGWN